MNINSPTMNIKYLNEKLEAILNTGFHLQRNA